MLFLATGTCHNALGIFFFFTILVTFLQVVNTEKTCEENSLWNWKLLGCVFRFSIAKIIYNTSMNLEPYRLSHLNWNYNLILGWLMLLSLKAVSLKVRIRKITFLVNTESSLMNGACVWNMQYATLRTKSGLQVIRST